MSVVVNQIMNDYRVLIHDYADPRTKDWFMMSSPVYLVVLLGFYNYWCNKAGPRFMEGRKPFELKNTILVYNIVQVLLSIYIVYLGLRSGWGREYKLICEPVDRSTNPTAMMMAEACFVYFISKISELLDTVFFVLRKKDNQISFLHLYHHTLMPIAGWIAVRYFPGGHGTFVGLINGFVHIFMYAYYLLAGLGPQYQKYLWWKNYITLLQLGQFFLLFWQNFLGIFTDCSYPKTLLVLITVESIVFMYLFGKFYIQTYTRKSKKSLNGEPLNNKKVK